MKAAPVLALAIASLAALASARAFGAEAVSAPHAVNRLVAETTTAPPGKTIRLALVQTLDPGWHTYWRNPGDAGEATRIDWTLPAGWSAGPILWPAPRRFPLGPIMNYGYDGKIVLPTAIAVPAGAKPGTTAHLRATVQYLVCAEVCIPGSANLSLDLPVAAGTPSADPQGAPLIAAAIAAAPRPAPGPARFQMTGGKLRLAIAGLGVAGAQASDAYFFPYRDDVIDQAAPQAVERGANGLTLVLAPGPALAKGAPPGRIDGVLEVDGQALEVAATPGAPPAGAAGFGPPPSSSDRTSKGGSALAGLLAAALGAFVGGVILNLMPCVFPILAMKAAALAGHGGEAPRARAEGLAFLAGVLASFLALAAVLIGLRAAGQAVGWGFQLQSPAIVAALALVMLAAGLDLSGVFEVGASTQAIGQGAGPKSALARSALTGALAVVVAAPCTAPFMGPALGFALTEPPLASLTVFAALGLGFAAPFTLLAASPALARRLPRPGAWMDTLRKALAFPMYAAAAWLAWVLAQQAGPAGLAALFAAAVSLAFAAWLFGLAQRRQSAARPARVALAAAGLSALASLAGVAAVAAAPPPTAAQSGLVGGLASQPYSEARLAALRAAGRPVFVNFTAAWCVTCQVNERVAFADPGVAAAFRRAGAVYLVADWTRRDGAIAKALAAQGRIGVPLYLVYRPGERTPRVLPQLLTAATVTGAIAPGVA